MTEQPSFESSGSDFKAARQAHTASYVRQMGRVLMVSLVGSALYALIVGPRNLTGLSNGLFFAGAILLTFGLMPLAVGIFGRAAASLKLEDRSLHDALEEQRTQSQSVNRLAFVFGISGLFVVALSMAIGFSVQ